MVHFLKKKSEQIPSTSSPPETKNENQSRPYFRFEHYLASISFRPAAGSSSCPSCDFCHKSFKANAMAVAVAVTDDVVVYLVVTKALKVVVVVEAVAVVVYLVVSVYTFCLDNTYTHF